MQTRYVIVPVDAEMACITSRSQLLTDQTSRCSHGFHGPPERYVPRSGRSPQSAHGFGSCCGNGLCNGLNDATGCTADLYLFYGPENDPVQGLSDAFPGCREHLPGEYSSLQEKSFLLLPVFLLQISR
jgi:hypothetical protein